MGQIWVKVTLDFEDDAEWNGPYRTWVDHSVPLPASKAVHCAAALVKAIEETGTYQTRKQVMDAIEQVVDSFKRDYGGKSINEDVEKEKG